MEVYRMDKAFNFAGVRYYKSDTMVVCDECIVVLNGETATEITYSDMLIDLFKKNGRNIPIG